MNATLDAYSIRINNGIDFTITEHPDPHGQGAPWYVTSDTVDPDGDHTWGHFPTHTEAVEFVWAVSTR